MLIVCIDNDPAILDGMRTLLNGWGARVITALDQATAMEALDGLGERRSAYSSITISTAATASPRSATSARDFGGDIPAILITADRSPHVREAASARGAYRRAAQAGEAGGAARPAARNGAAQQTVAAE